MKSLKNCLLLLLLIFWGIVYLRAQDTDYTNLIINNDFEIAPDANCNPITIVPDINGWSNNAWRPKMSSCTPQKFYGWACDLSLTGTSTSQGINANPSGGHGNWGCWVGGNSGSSSTQIDFEFYQIINATDLPAGTYKVQCVLAVGSGNKKNNQRLFANSNVQYYGNPSDYLNNIVSGEQYTFAGHTSFGDSDLKEMVVYTTVGEDEPLKIGIRTSNKKGDGTTTIQQSPMFRIDYFRLTKLDPAKTTDATLESLTLSAGDLNFSSEITSYDVLLPAGVKHVTATAVPTMPGVSVNGSGTVDVSSGLGISTIVVTAPDGVTTKTYTINYTVETGVVILEQNILPHWDANGLGLNQANIANTEMWRWGWNTSNLTSYPWGLANQSNRTRFCDMPTVYSTVTKNGVPYVGRFAQLRWDGTGGTTTYTTLGYGDGTAAAPGVPTAIQLTEGLDYNFSFWGFGNEGSSYIMYVTTDPTGADQTKTIASTTISELSNHTSMKLFSLDFNCPATGAYYMVFKYLSGSASILFIADVNLHLVTIPKALASTGVTKTEFTANWKGVSGSTAYELDVATDNAFTNFVVGYNNKTVSGTSVVVSGLTEGTTYYYRVRAVKETVVSANSNVITLTTIAATAPVAPVIDEATNVGPQTFTISWSNVEGAISYKLDVATDIAFTKIVAPYNNLNTTETSQTIAGLKPNTNYYCRVRAFNGSNSSYSTTATLKTQKLLIVLLAGQSNMAGRGIYSQLTPADTVTYTNILSLNKDSVWVRAKHPLHWEKSEAAVGMGISFAKTLADKIGGDVAIGLVPCAAGGTNIDKWLADEWFAYTGNFYLYTNLITRAKKAAESGDVIGMIWHQGEANATTITTPTYQEKMITLFTRIRTDLNMSAMPIVAGELGRYLTYTYLTETNAAINGLSSILTNYAVASSLSLTANSDNLHFTAVSQVEFGKRYANQFYPLYENFTSVNEKKMESKIKLSVSNNVLRICTGNISPATVNFYNTLGVLIKTCVVKNSVNDISLPNIKGVCVINIQHSEGTYTQKILL
jgi:hypothetical protein